MQKTHILLAMLLIVNGIPNAASKHTFLHAEKYAGSSILKKGAGASWVHLSCIGLPIHVNELPYEHCMKMCKKRIKSHDAEV